MMTLKEITAEQSKMIDYILLGENISNIAEKTKKTRQTIYNWLQLDYVQEELNSRRNELKKTARNRVTSQVSNLLNNMFNLAYYSNDQRVKLQANKYLLDQCIGISTEVKESTNTSKIK